MGTDERIRRLEENVEAVWERVLLLERAAPRAQEPRPVEAPRPRSMPPLHDAPVVVVKSPPSPPRHEPVPSSAKTQTPSAAMPPAPRPAAPTRDLEDLLGGRVLAWVGGFAVLVGLVFLVAVAISHGWIGEAQRTLLAGAASAAMLLVGVRAHERHGRTDASLALVAAGIAGLFGTVTVATSGYHLLPALAGLGLAFGVGAIATILAVRWEAQGVGALGIVGCLLSPALVSASYDASTIGFLFLAGASAVGVLLWQRWDWLALATVSLAAFQWVPWLFDGASLADAVVTLCAFGTLGAVAALGYDVRAAGRPLRSISAAIFAGNALLLAGAGFLALHELSGAMAGQVWLVALAAAHIVTAGTARRVDRLSDELHVVVLGVGIVLADLAIGATVRGPALAVTWAATAAAFAYARRHVKPAGHEGQLAVLGVGAHVALSLGQALIHQAPPGAIGGGAHDLAGAMVALSAVAGACFASGRLLAGGRREVRLALDAFGLAVVAYQTAIALDGVALVVALAAQAVALAQISRRTDDSFASTASLAFAGIAGLHALSIEATPDALLDGVEPLWPALVATLSVGAALLRAGDARRDGLRGPVLLAGCSVLLYAASITVVTALGGHELQNGVAVAHAQQPQLVLSALWALVGVVGLIAGLRGDQQLARHGALALLLITVAKVFLYDLAALDSVYRVGSCIGVGLLLLAGAHAYQRLRPRPLPDIREAPDAIRDGLFAS